MKNCLLTACFLVFGLLISAPLVKAQCAHNPTVSGDTLMCPNSTGTLTTQTADSYQWYKRLYSDPTLAPIAGETSQTLALNSADDVLYYFAVEATVGGCAEMSPEVLVDGLVFLPIAVSTTGDFTITGNGIAEVCQGDTAFLNVLMPYDTNVVWNNNGNPIAGETGTTLVVTTSGSYTVSASPSVCPNYTDFMFIDIVVNVVDCDTNCAHDPTVFGDTMLCPGSNGILSTQTYDSYQWYKRLYSDTVSAPIPGATSQTLAINADDDVLYYFSVAATENGCTEMSPEVLVDGLAFASITVSTTGDFTIGGNGQVQLCEGDTVFLNLLLPYDTNIVWFNGGTPVTGADEPTLVVTDAGSFTVSGAPHICPNFTQTMGIPIDVVMDDCSTAGVDENGLDLISIYPNPATDRIVVDGKTHAIERFKLINPLGQTVMLGNPQSNTVNIDLGGMASGTYILQVETASGKILRKIVKY